MPLRQWIKSADYAIEGILHAVKTQRHLRYHFYSASAVLLISYILGISKTEFVIVSLAVISVLLAEMFNTAVETIVDFISPERNEKARIAKDISAGAVLITAFGAALIGLMILFPYARDIFQSGIYITKHVKEEVAVIAFVLVLIMVILLKSYWGKGHPLSGGLPSGHSAVAFSVWVSVTYMTESFIVSLLCFILAVAIAQSRVATRVHSAWEVVLGGLLGATLTFVLFKVLT
ncbi:MAG: diacylglycerol kinase [Nitrospirae bacterium]|nr:diacylglycerol kinase [Nitrospirota bacterium]